MSIFAGSFFYPITATINGASTAWTIMDFQKRLPGTANLLEMSVRSDSGLVSTNMNIHLARIPQVNAQLGAANLINVDPNDANVSDVYGATTWSSAPNVPNTALVLRRNTFTSSITAFAVCWTFPRGLGLTYGQSWVLYTINATTWVCQHAVDVIVDE